MLRTRREYVTEIGAADVAAKFINYLNMSAAAELYSLSATHDSDKTAFYICRKHKKRRFVS